MNKESLLKRGQLASQLLASGVYEEARLELESELKESWAASRPDDEDGRERLYLMTQLMADIGRILLRWQGDAQIEIHNAERAKREQQ